MNLAEAFNQTFAGTSAKQPKKSDRIQQATPLNMRGAFEAATNIPVVGDALSGGMAVYDAVKGDYPSAAMNALGVLPFVSGTFIGKGAKTWDAVKAAEAEKRLAAGDDVRKVWKETGTFKGPDGHLRQEIDDSSARFNIGKLGDYPGVSYGQSGIVSDALKHKQLTNSYHDLGAIELSINPREFGQRTSASYMRGGSVIPENVSMTRDSKGQMIEAAREESRSALDMVNDPSELDWLVSNFGSKSAAEKWAADSAALHNRKADLIKAGYAPDRGAKSDILHELQHAIQQREGWARGGSSESMVNDYLKDNERLNDLKSKMQKYENAASDEARYANQELKTKAQTWYDDFMGDFGKSAPIEEKVKDYLLNQDGLYKDWYKEHARLAYPSKNGVMASVLPEDRYRRLAGEAEARATQARMNMNMDQRLNTYPLDSYDVPVDQLIIRGNTPLSKAFGAK